jgi:O-antigen/teichoic acid export membrane protein
MTKDSEPYAVASGVPHKKMVQRELCREESMFEEVKSVTKHFLVYGVGNVLSKIAGFILIPVYTHYLATSEYGTLELLELTTYVAGMFLAVGITESLMRFYYDSEDPKKRHEVVSTALLWIWGISIFGVVWFLVFSPDISLLVFNTRGNAGLFRLIFLSMTFSLAGEIPLSFIRAQQKSVLFTTISVSRLIFNVGLNVLFIVSFGWGIRGIILSGLITQGLTSIVLSVYTFSQTGFSLSLANLRNMIKYGIPYIPGGVGLFIIHFVDRFLLQRFTSLSEVGIYSLGYKFGMILNPLVNDPFFSIWKPKMFELAERKDAKEIYSVMFTYFLFIEIFLALGISILIKDVLVLISVPAYHSAYKIVPLILLSYVLWGSYFQVQIGILLKKKTRYIACIVAVSAAISLALNFLLIPRIGMWGAALSTLVSFGVTTVLTYVISNRIYAVRYQFGRIFKLLTLAVVLYLASLCVNTNSLFSSLFVKSILVLSFPFWLFLLRFYSQPEIGKIKEMVSQVTRSFRLTFARPHWMRKK